MKRARSTVSASDLSPMAKRYRREIELLHWRGYFPQYKSVRKALLLIDQPTLDEAMDEFELLTGKKSKPDEMEYRFCALPDKAPLRASICQWPMVNVTWHTIGGLGSISPEDVKASYALACSWWNEICAIRLRYSDNPKTANIVARAANLGGPGNVLADSGLPCGGSTRQIPQRYDGENWVISENPRGGEIDLTRVQCHELGHALGSDHIGTGNLLAPMYSTRLRKPQAGDVAEMQRRYPGAGETEPPPSPPTPTPTPVPPGQKTIRITGGANISAAGPGQFVITTSGLVKVD